MEAAFVAKKRGHNVVLCEAADELGFDEELLDELLDFDELDDELLKLLEELEAAGLTCEVFTFADSNDVANVVSAACASSDVLYIPTDNTAASCAETINNVALPAGTPIISGEENACKGFGVATLSISYFDIGYIAGEMAAEILAEGANPGEMEIGYAPEVIKKYNADNCAALGITPPEDYVAIG